MMFENPEAIAITIGLVFGAWVTSIFYGARNVPDTFPYHENEV